MIASCLCDTFGFFILCRVPGMIRYFPRFLTKSPAYAITFKTGVVSILNVIACPTLIFMRIMLIVLSLVEVMMFEFEQINSPDLSVHFLLSMQPKLNT